MIWNSIYISAVADIKVLTLRDIDNFLFKPTRPDRDWIIDPFKGECNPWITVVAAFPPGVLAAILMFMDQHIPTVIITRKEKKLKVISYPYS